MANTIREQIIQAFVTRLKTITTANGYTYDFDTKIFRHVPSLSNNILPAAVVVDRQERSELKYGVQKSIFGIEVNVYGYRTDAVESSELHNIFLGDFIKCVMSGDKTYSGLAVDTEYKMSDVEYPEDGNTLVSTVLSFVIEYETPLGDPFSNV